MDWNDLLLAYFHDPPDKALKLPGQEDHAVAYASTALSRTVTVSELRGNLRLEEMRSSIMKWLPMPPTGSTEEQIARMTAGGRVHSVHPLAGIPTDFAGPSVGKDLLKQRIASLVESVDDPRARFFAMWRFLPESVESIAPEFALLPVESLLPDNSAWRHMDITAGLHAALCGDGGAAFLSFSIGPVQPFIEAARSVRDLWSGSAILSWIAFRGMLPVVRELGPTALVFPSLRGTPLLDLWMAREFPELMNRRELKPGIRAKVPSLPNRFLALVPYGEDGSTARDYAERVEQSARDAWHELTERVLAELAGKMSIDPDRWHDQVEGFFDLKTSVLSLREWDESQLANLSDRTTFEEAFPNAAAVRSLANAIPASERVQNGPDRTGIWQAQVGMAARLMESCRSVRHVPMPGMSFQNAVLHPPKCSLLGSYEQMGPANLEESNVFWNDFSQKISVQGVRLRPGERFSAIALAKRFAVPAFLAQEFGLRAETLHFPDTATVAAGEWLAKHGIVPDQCRDVQGAAWSGQWLHWPRPNFDKGEEAVPPSVWAKIEPARRESPPPAYYAILMMDADHMGRWLKGEHTPKVEEVLHPAVRAYFESRPEVQKGLKANRPVGPVLHAAISEALGNFALHIVPSIVERHYGTLIYAGGDDVLALLPVRTAVRCARELRDAFRGEAGDAPPGYYRHKGRNLLVMGPKATLSAGIALVHHKEDLRLALSEARRAEKAAKEGGRDALQLCACRRSGEHSSARCPWDFSPQLDSMTEAFCDGASDRWAYRLRAELPTLEGLPKEVAEAEVRRLINRGEALTRKQLGQGDASRAADMVASQFVEYLRLRGSEKGCLADFVTLCQSASFMARGRDTQ